MTRLAYKIDPPVSDEELQNLFADAWDSYVPRPFANILGRSLGYVACVSLRVRQTRGLRYRPREAGDEFRSDGLPFIL